MSKSYYECHITIEGDKELARQAVQNISTSRGPWKFSAIDGDIVMGEGIKCYATRHFNTRKPLQEVFDEIVFAALVVEEHAGLKVLRRKIEKVLFDDRSSKVGSCQGGCVECHLDDLKEAS